MSIEDLPWLPERTHTPDGRWKLITRTYSKRLEEQFKRSLTRRISKRLHVGMTVKYRWTQEHYQVWSPGPRRNEWWVVDENGKAYLKRQIDLYIVKHTCQEV